VNGTETEVRDNHCSAVSPENWSIHPDTIFEEEKQLIENALNSTDQDFLKYLPGKVYFPILIEKLGVGKSAYVNLIVEALRSVDDDPLQNLGEEIRIGLEPLLQNG